MTQPVSSTRDAQPSVKPFLGRVRIRNYKSIGKCDIELSALTVVVGRNGSGKSNFLDALRFVVDGLQTSLDHAIKTRGGLEAVRRRSTGHPRNFAVELEIVLPQWKQATFGFEIAARRKGGFAVKREELRIQPHAGVGASVHYHVANGEVVETSASAHPPAVPDRLYLVAASGLPEFRPVYDVIVAMGFYNLNPEAMKELQSPDAGELLHRDGSNIASVIARLSAGEPSLKDRINQYLETIVPGITDVERASLGPKETLQFKQEVRGSSHPWKFFAVSMSDGTLRALGTLIAVSQLAHQKTPVRLIGIEEPETALHPAAAGALMDALNEATEHTQVVVTTHSPDLLDQLNLDRHRLLAVESRQGTTSVAEIDSASRQAIRDHLYTAGELQRMDQLELDENDVRRQEQMKLFGTIEDDE